MCTKAVFLLTNTDSAHLALCTFQATSHEINFTSGRPKLCL